MFKTYLKYKKKLTELQPNLKDAEHYYEFDRKTKTIWFYSSSKQNDVAFIQENKHGIFVLGYNPFNLGRIYYQVLAGRHGYFKDILEKLLHE